MNHKDFSVRHFQSEDLTQCIQLLRNYFMNQAIPTFISLLFKETIYEVTILTISIGFVFLGISLFKCIFFIPVILLTSFIIVYICFIINSSEACEVMKSLVRRVEESKNECILVAEINMYSECINSEVNKTAKYLDINEYLKYYVPGAKSTIAGFLVILTCKHDVQKAWLKWIIISDIFKKHIVIKDLLNEAENFCKQSNYNGIATVVNDNNCPVIELLLENDYEFNGLYQKYFLNFLQTVTLNYYFKSVKQQNYLMEIKSIK